MGSRKLLKMNMRNMIKVTISGDSMSPLYLDGDEVTVDKGAYSNESPKVGDVILFKHPFIKDYFMIKKISDYILDYENKKRYYVIGIHQENSTDSRSFGTIKFEDIIGKVI